MIIIGVSKKFKNEVNWNELDKGIIIKKFSGLRNSVIQIQDVQRFAKIITRIKAPEYIVMKMTIVRIMKTVHQKRNIYKYH